MFKTKTVKFLLKRNVHWIAIAVGGAVGALGRFGISSVVSESIYAVFICNIIGTFIISLAIEFRRKIHAELKNMIAIGFCGGISIFATFSKDSVYALQHQNYLLFFGNFIANFVACVALAFLASEIIRNLTFLRLKMRKARRWRKAQ